MVLEEEYSCTRVFFFVCNLSSLSKTSFEIGSVNVNIRMYNIDDRQCTVISSAAYGFVAGMNHQLCLSHGHGEVIDQQ